MTSGNPLGSMASPASLWPPRLVSLLSAWNEHVPFAGWVVEATQPRVLVELGTHAGVSYFAFCESVARLGIGTRCYAVDTWVGDEHAGEYGEEIYRDVHRLNAEYYEGFSTLIRKTFDGAVDEFADGSVDLLHIDGYHTYEAVKHDFETWLPKLSDRAVVLLHDTNERKADFGVYRFMAELAEQYPTFEFTHGHGLGVVCVGGEIPDAAGDLVSIDDPAEIVETRQLYAALGRRLIAELEASTYGAKSKELGSELKWTTTALETTREELAESRGDHKATRAEKEAVVAQKEAILGDNADLRRDLKSTDRELEWTTAALDQTRGELADVRRETSGLTQQLDAANRLAESSRLKVASQAEQLDHVANRARSAELQLVERDQQIEIRDVMYQELLNRRVVRVALKVAGLAKPMFRAVRGTGTDTAEGPTAEVAPIATTSDIPIRRQFEGFDDALDAQTTRELRAHYQSDPALADTLVSIILPTYNRAEQMQTAIDSIKVQTHASWELLVVDDGSTDETAVVLEHVAIDPRIRPIALERGGVSRARNAALDAAGGDVIAFLDSDNVWNPDFLELMVAGLDQTGSDIAYSAMRLETGGATVGYRGARFDYDECARSNYVDINVLCHRRSIVESGKRFDESLRRMNDWDYLLRISRDTDVAFFPFIGAVYTFEASGDQISVREPVLYKKIIQHRHGGVGDDARSEEDARAIFRQIPLTVCLRVAAPRGNRNEWGDYHYALGVRQALERRGHTATIAFRDDEIADHYDVVISLTGLVKHPPVPISVNVLWSISHPDLLTMEEIDGFDLFVSASLTWPKSLAWARTGENHTLIQATDRARFYPRERRSDVDDEVLFVGNSRGVERWIVEQALAADVPLAVYGNSWSDRLPDAYLRGTYIPNERLGQHYSDAAIVLNDHWESMKQFGYVSNRVFDVTASGGSLVSDDLPSLKRIFGNDVTTVHNAADLRSAVERISHGDHTRPPDIAPWVVEHHSFDNRVGSLLSHLEDFLFSTSSYAGPSLGRQLECALCDVAGPETEAGDTDQPRPDESDRDPIFVRGQARRLALGVLPQPTGVAFTSSTYIRLVQPLTTELDSVDVQLRHIDANDRPADHLDGLDALVVSRVAVRDSETAATIVDRADQLSIPLIVDVDDAFHLMDESHSEYLTYAPLNAALAVLLDSAQEVWASTEPLAESLRGIARGSVEVVANSLDERLWKTYREESDDSDERDDDTLQILYAGTMTHGGDFASILPAFDQLAREVDFGLTVVGIGDGLPERSWLRSMPAGDEALYPRYARWLRGRRRRFDIGIAPLVDSVFNGFKSDVKIMEYLALGLVPLASNVGPYARTELLDDAMRLDDTRDWAQCLSRLAWDVSYRDSMIATASELEDRMWATRNSAMVGAGLVSRIETLAGRMG